MSENEPVHPTKARAAGPADFTDPQLRWEMKRAAVWLGLAGLIVLTVFLAQPLLVIFGGLVFAAMIDGGARLLGRVLPLPRGWRVSIVILLAAAFLIWTLTFAGTQLANQAAQLPALVESQAIRVIDWLRGHGVRIDFAAVQGVMKEVVGGVGQVTHALGGIIGGATTLFLILVLGIYISAEPRLYQRGVAWMFPISERGHFHATAAQMGKSLRRLMAGRMLGMALEGVLCWIALSLYGVPMAALLGLLTGILAFIPNIGAPISGLIMVMVGFSVDTSTGLYCIIVYFVLHTVDGNLVAPYIARKTVDLAPALVLGAQLIMGTLFGILGLALADPLVAMIKIALERHSARHEAEWQAAHPEGETEEEGAPEVEGA